MRNFLRILFLLFTTVTVYAQPSSDKLIRQGVALHDKKHYKEAISCYEEALKVNPTSMSAVYEMSLSYLQLKEYDKTLKYSNKVIVANFQPLLVDAYVVKATASAHLNKLNESIKILNEALEKCGDEYLLHFNLGLSYFNNKNAKMAVTHLRKAIELDATHPSAFLLYAYASNDLGRWIQSFYSFHFFLLLEPNTERSKDAFGEMYDILDVKLDYSSIKLTPEDGVDRKLIYESIHAKKTGTNDAQSQYRFFLEASKSIFFLLSQMQNDSQSGLLWDFFVPTYDEILGSGHFETYCKYVSVAYFPESLVWWNENRDQVDNFIEWFEYGQGGTEENEDGISFGDDSDLEEDEE